MFSSKAHAIAIIAIAVSSNRPIKTQSRNKACQQQFDQLHVQLCALLK